MAESTTKRKAQVLRSDVESVDPERFESFKVMKALDAHVETTVQRHLRRLAMCTQATPKMIRKTLALSFHYSFDDTKNADNLQQCQDFGEWTFRVEGTVMNGPHPWPTSRKFSHFFNKAHIELDDRLFPGNTPIEWSSGKTTEGSDGFQITRPGKKGFSSHVIRLQLMRNQSPEMFVMSRDLYDAIGGYIKPNLGTDDGYSKADISIALWNYIKEKDLQKSNDSTIVVNDTTFQGIFECKEIPIHSIHSHLQKKLSPVGPLSVEFTLPLDPSQKGEVRLDTKQFTVDVLAEEALLNAQRTAMDNCIAHDKSISQESQDLEQRMADIVERINTHMESREWMKEFCKDPSVFMERVVASQETDEKILSSLAKKTPTAAHLHDPEVYSQPWIHSTIEMILKREH
ncbi:unnamed protein product [Aphanomyces euteiches]